MNRIRGFVAPTYLLGIGLIGIPIIDALTTVWPVKAGTVAWRFAAAGVFSRALVTTLLGFLIIMLVANLLERRRIVRLGAILSVILAVALAALIVTFALDAAQSRQQVPPQAKTPFDMTVLIALGKYGWAVVVYAWLGVAAWRSSRGAFARAKSGVQTPLIGVTEPPRAG